VLVNEKASAYASSYLADYLERIPVVRGVSRNVHVEESKERVYFRERERGGGGITGRDTAKKGPEVQIFPWRRKKWAHRRFFFFRKCPIGDVSYEPIGKNSTANVNAAERITTFNLFSPPKRGPSEPTAQRRSAC
jgi:hypothetical protein